MHSPFRLSLSLLLINAIISCHSNPYRQGQVLYKFHCESCHMEDGSGLAKLIPSLTSSKVWKATPEGLICLIRYGLPKNKATDQQMPANTILNDVEMANLVNYLREVYSPDSIAVTTFDVNKWLLNCKPD